MDDLSVDYRWVLVGPERMRLKGKAATLTGADPPAIWLRRISLPTILSSVFVPRVRSLRSTVRSVGTVQYSTVLEHCGIMYCRSEFDSAYFVSSTSTCTGQQIRVLVYRKNQWTLLHRQYEVVLLKQHQEEQREESPHSHCQRKTKVALRFSCRARRGFLDCACEYSSSLRSIRGALATV